MWSTRHLYYQGALSFNKGLLGSTIPVCTIPDTFLNLNTGVVFTLLYQFQGSGIIRSLARKNGDSSNELGVSMRL